VALAAAAGGIARLPTGLGQRHARPADAYSRTGGVAAGVGNGTGAVEAAGVDGNL
jgi:hypothetical protein